MSDLWAITAYFNPAGYQSRRDNYRRFRAQLRVPLVTVEAAGDGRFDLEPADADILIRLPCRDVLWQKERLLNVALQMVPLGCRSIAWLDCDVVFAGDWVAGTLQALQRHALVQPFRNLVDLPPGADPGGSCPGPGASRLSFGHLWESGAVPADLFRISGGSVTGGRRYTLGHAWAARRDLLERHGFYDAFILGSGNKLLAAAACGQTDDSVASYAMTDRQAAHYRAWAEPFAERVAGRVAATDGTLLHLWHGALADRNYSGRYAGFRRFHFDPFTDVAVDEHGCWRWTSSKPEMHEYVRRYFEARKEDGVVTSPPSAGSAGWSS